MYFVYIIFSEIRKRYYVGQTSDIDQRLQRHNCGKVKSTKTGIPWKLIKAFKLSSRSESILLESRIKKRGIDRFLTDIQIKKNN